MMLAVGQTANYCYHMSNTLAPELFAKRVLSVLKTKDISLKTLSRDSGIAYSSLWRKLHKKPETFDLDDMTAIADALHVELKIGFAA